MESKVMWIWLPLLIVGSVAGAIMGGPIVAACFIGGLALLTLGLLHPQKLAPALVLVAMFFSRPNIWGEQLSNIALALFLAAILVAIVQDQGKLAFTDHRLRPALSPLLWVTVAYLWLLIRTSYQGLENAGQIMGGFLGTAVCVLAVVVVAADSRRRMVLVKGFVSILVLCCLSYVVTAALWTVSGIGSGAIASINVGTWPQPQPVYFPFTATVATQSVFGLQLPRFVGFGREPGWMAMYCCVAYLLLPFIGWRSKILKVALIVGMLGTVSTAGFGVLLICVALNFTFNGRTRSSFELFLRFSFGLCLMAFAIWAAFYAPILGFDAKGEQNGISLSERSLATNMGILAFENDPFSGGLAADKVGAVNLVAAIAAYGLPFSVAMGLATIGPFFRHTNRWRLLPVAAALFLTLLMSQPALDSAWVFALASLAAAAALDQPPLNTEKKDPRLAAKKLRLPDEYKKFAVSSTVNSRPRQAS